MLLLGWRARSKQDLMVAPIFFEMEIARGPSFIPIILRRKRPIPSFNYHHWRDHATLSESFGIPFEKCHDRVSPPQQQNTSQSSQVQMSSKNWNHILLMIQRSCKFRPSFKVLVANWNPLFYGIQLCCGLTFHMLRPDFWWRSRLRLWRISKNGSFSIGRSYHKGFMRTFLQQKGARGGGVRLLRGSFTARPWKVTIPKGEDRLPTSHFSWENSLSNFGSAVFGHHSHQGIGHFITRGLKIEKSRGLVRNTIRQDHLAPWLSLAAMAWASGDTCAESCQGKWLSMDPLRAWNRSQTKKKPSADI